MRSKLICVLMMAVMSALLVITNSAEPETTWEWTTPGTSGINLNGKMFTLSLYRGGISFYPPYYSAAPTPWPSTPPNPTRRYPTRFYYTTSRPYYSPQPATTKPAYTTKPTTKLAPTTKPTTKPAYTTKPTTTPYPHPRYTTRPYYPTTYPYPWTSAPPTRGVSVCLRYLADYTSFSLFTISPTSRNPLRLEVSNAGYQLTFQYGYQTLYLRPNIRFWSNPGADIWTRVCLTVDSMKNVAQVFSGSNMSIRKLMPIRYAWSGQPVIDLSGFDGQMTDLQVWDYPLRYKEIFNYMTGGVYMPYRGSVLTWSHISYNPRGSILLEDAYERQARQPIGSSKEGGEGRRRGRRPKGETMKTMKLYYMESKSENIK